MAIFRVWCPELGQEYENGRRVVAHDWNRAAISWAKLGDDGWPRQSAVQAKRCIHVRQVSSGEELVMKVSREMVPFYLAWVVEPGSDVPRKKVCAIAK